VGSLRYRLDKEFIPNWDNRVRITIHDPYVTLQVEDRLTKKVPVKPIILGEVTENQMIDEAAATPNEIEISGPKSDIGRITELTTDPIDVSGLAESKSIIAAISKAALPELQLSSHEVNVSIKLGPKKLSKNLSVIPIEIVGSEKVGSVRPAGVSIVIAVPESQFHKLNQKDIRASVNAKELEPGRYELAVLVAAPEGVVVQQISPKNVTVEIYNQRKLRP
jgi:YbbR domain-containing protein